jgi:hypothetical protein
MNITPVSGSIDFAFLKGSNYDLIAIFDTESLPTNITYGPLNEKKINCTVRIDTTLEQFMGKSKF